MQIHSRLQMHSCLDCIPVPPSQYSHLSYTLHSHVEVASEDTKSSPRKLNSVDLSLYAVTDSSLNEKLGHSMEDVSLPTL
jgi:hypothetical protein